eukprot:2597542-Prorocentrum_lima.AAC.1
MALRRSHSLSRAAFAFGFLSASLSEQVLATAALGRSPHTLPFRVSCMSSEYTKSSTGLKLGKWRGILS